MLRKIERIIKNIKEISGYKIFETKTESSELFFVKKNVDMDRAKNVSHYTVTVYINYEEEGKKYTGSATANVDPTMKDDEITKVIEDAAFAARFIKNPYYPLTRPAASYQTAPESKFARESLPYWMNEITKAVYQNDIYEKGGINSCEIFLNKKYTHIINSEGVDAESVHYDGMVEFITTWKEDGEEIELYRCVNFSDFEPEVLSEEVRTMIEIAKEKAMAKKTPELMKYPVILTREAVLDFFGFYCSKSNAGSVYNKVSTWKPGDNIQGEEVKGDRITMTADPFLGNSTASCGFDEDGFPLKAFKIIDQGVLCRYIANTRYAHYLEVEPTGTILNIIVNGGSRTLGELRREPHLETAAFSDFSVDELSGDFCGEIRLAWYFDGEKTIPVTGGSVSGNIFELQNELYLSKELQKDNNYEGPAAVKLMNVTIAGVE
jgi:PmbA protein